MADFVYERTVNYYETDRMGIVHHSNYIRFMEEARIELLSRLGMPYDKMEEAGVLIPVLSVSCEYRKSFQFGDIMQIQVYPISFNGIKLKLGYRIYKKETGELHTTGETGHCFLDKNMKMIRFKRDYPEFYSGLAKWSEQAKELAQEKDGKSL